MLHFDLNKSRKKHKVKVSLQKFKFYIFQGIEIVFMFLFAEKPMNELFTGGLRTNSQCHERKNVGDLQLYQIVKKSF